MESYLRFWRLFPRLALGFLFFSSLLFASLDKTFLYEQAGKLTSINVETIGNFSSGIILIILIVLFCSLGLFLLELICFAMGLLLVRLFQFRLLKSFSGWVGLSDLTTPVSDLSLSILTTNKDHFLEFVYLKNASNPELLPHGKKVKQYSKEAVNHAVKEGNKALIENHAYYGGLTQDRKLLEDLRDSIDEIYYLLITFIVVLITCLQFHFRTAVYIGWAVFIAAGSYPLLLLTRKRREMYAFFILMYYLDSFTTWEAATYEERDAI